MVDLLGEDAGLICGAGNVGPAALLDTDPENLEEDLLAQDTCAVHRRSEVTD